MHMSLYWGGHQFFLASGQNCRSAAFFILAIFDYGGIEGPQKCATPYLFESLLRGLSEACWASLSIILPYQEQHHSFLRSLIVLLFDNYPFVWVLWYFVIQPTFRHLYHSQGYRAKSIVKCLSNNTALLDRHPSSNRSIDSLCNLDNDVLPERSTKKCQNVAGITKNNNVYQNAYTKKSIIEQLCRISPFSWSQLLGLPAKSFRRFTSILTIERIRRKVHFDGDLNQERHCRWHVFIFIFRLKCCLSYYAWHCLSTVIFYSSLSLSVCVRNDPNVDASTSCHLVGGVVLPVSWGLSNTTTGRTTFNEMGRRTHISVVDWCWGPSVSLSFKVRRQQWSLTFYWGHCGCY